MTGLINVGLHVSAFPRKPQSEVLASLRARKVDPKLHYVSYKQAQKWLEIHGKYAPSPLNSKDRKKINSSYRAAVDWLSSSTNVSVIALGCGAGEKEAALLKVAKCMGRGLEYSPSDISVPLVITAARSGTLAAPSVGISPVVFDLSKVENLEDVFKKGGNRLITCFGLLPNFEPDEILPKIARFLRRTEVLLVSTNLAPGSEYTQGVERVLPGYDNAETREWLGMFLYDLGVMPDDGTVHFAIEEGRAGIKRIVAHFHFNRNRMLRVEGRKFKFATGDKIRLFFSYRYTPELLRKIFAKHGLRIVHQNIIYDGEEGIFVCRRESFKTDASLRERRGPGKPRGF